MLSKIGRFFRKLGKRSADQPERSASEAQVPQRSEGDAFAREVLDRVRPAAVSRPSIRQVRAMPAGRTRLPVHYRPPARRDVSTGGVIPPLPLVGVTPPLPLVGARPALHVAQEALHQETGGEHKTFFAESTGDPAWDALWNLRGTRSEAEAVASRGVDHPEGSSPEERQPPSQAERRSPTSPSRSVQRTEAQRAPPQRAGELQGTAPASLEPEAARTASGAPPTRESPPIPARMQDGSPATGLEAGTVSAPPAPPSETRPQTFAPLPGEQVANVQESPPAGAADEALPEGPAIVELPTTPVAEAGPRAQVPRVEPIQRAGPDAQRVQRARPERVQDPVGGSRERAIPQREPTSGPLYPTDTVAQAPIHSGRQTEIDSTSRGARPEPVETPRLQRVEGAHPERGAGIHREPVERPELLGGPRPEPAKGPEPLGGARPDAQRAEGTDSGPLERSSSEVVQEAYSEPIERVRPDAQRVGGQSPVRGAGPASHAAHESETSTADEGRQASPVPPVSRLIEGIRRLLPRREHGRETVPPSSPTRATTPPRVQRVGQDRKGVPDVGGASRAEEGVPPGQAPGMPLRPAQGGPSRPAQGGPSRPAQGMPLRPAQAAGPESPPASVTMRADGQAAPEADTAEDLVGQSLRRNHPALETLVARPRPTAQRAPAEKPFVRRAPLQRTEHGPDRPVHDTVPGEQSATPALSSRRQAAPSRPDAPSGGPPLPVPTPDTAPEPVTVQHMIDSREALRQALQPRLVPSTVQTVPEDAGTQSASAAAAPGGEEQREDGPEEQDIESLARDVYRILRRRLLVERERELGRL